MSAVLQTLSLTKAFGGLKVIDDLSFSVSPGERLALIGPNGAGKTTLIDLLTGVTAPDTGEVRLKDELVNRIGIAGRVSRGLGRSFQITRLFKDMTVKENIGLAVMQRQGTAFRFYGNFCSMPKVMSEVMRLLEALAIASLADRKAGDIAYGQQRLVELAITLAGRPDVLLLDEPAAGVPQSDIARIECALQNLPSHLAVLLVDHDMDLVFRFATRVIVLVEGAIIFDGAPKDAGTDEKVRRAYLGSYADAGSFD